MKNFIRKINLLLFSGSVVRLMWHLKLIGYLKQTSHDRFAQIVSNRIQRKFCIFISHKARLSNTIKFPHPTGIVIGDGVSIGEDVTIYQNVTLGGARIGDAQNNHYPEIGNGTVIFAGAVIVGNVRVGQNCVIGANSVVLHDVPDNSTAVGVPARVISTTLPVPFREIL